LILVHSHKRVPYGTLGILGRFFFEFFYYIFFLIGQLHKCRSGILGQFDFEFFAASVASSEIVLTALDLLVS